MEDLDKIKFKNKENKETYILLKKLMDLREEAKNGKGSTKLRYEKHFAFLYEKFSYIPEIHTKKYLQFSNYEDLLQEGKLGLIIALKNFDMNRSNNFYKLANLYVKTRIKRAANKFDVINVPMEVAKDAPPVRVSVDSDFIPNTKLYIDNLDPAKQFENMEKSKKIREVIISLPQEHKSIICMYYGLKIINKEFVFSSSIKRKNVTEISSCTGISRNKIKKIIDNTNSKIKQL